MSLTETEQLRIACDLADRGVIQREHYQVWRRRKEGESLPQIRLTVTVQRRSGRECHPDVRTLKRWTRTVREAIVTEQQGRVRFAITVASGSDAWEVADLTPQGKTPGSSWDTEGLKRVGARDRW